jgi:hypothetical protein
MNLADLKNAHSIAGAEYAAAVERLKTAYIELAAIDVVLANGNVGHGEVVPTFGRLPQNPDGFAHPKFAPIDHAVDWHRSIAKRRDALLKALS